MSTFHTVIAALYVGGILGYLLNIWCSTEGKDNGLQVAFHTAIWPVLGAFLVCMYLWMRAHPEPPPPP